MLSGSGVQQVNKSSDNLGLRSKVKATIDMCSKEWHDSESQLHSRPIPMNFFHPHPVPIYLTTIPTPSPYIWLQFPPHPHKAHPRPHSCWLEHWSVRSISMYRVTCVCNLYANKNFTLAVTVICKTLFCKIKSSNDSSMKHEQPGEQWSR